MAAVPVKSEKHNNVLFDMAAAGITVGDTIIEGKNKRTEVKEVTLCGSHRDHIHVNKSDCYWMNGRVQVERPAPAPMSPEERLLWAIFPDREDLR